MAVYFCRKCGANVEENYTPRPNGCPVSVSHAWIKVSGAKRFYCRKCHMSVFCDTAPNASLGGGCSGVATRTHAWIQG